MRQMTPVAAAHALTLPSHQYAQPQQRTQGQPSQQCLVEQQQAALNRPHPFPILATHVVRLGIDARYGKVLVAMVGTMTLSIQREGKPQPERWEDNCEPQPLRHAAKRVDGLVLQREM